MNRHIPWLAALLLIQLVLVGAGAWRHGVPSDGAPWLEFESARVDGIRIEDGDGAHVTLARTDGEWRLAGGVAVPVAADKVDRLLERLAGDGPQWPVATSAAAAKRFSVTDDDFQRRIQLYAGERLLADALLGSSPGFRRIHARAGGADAIFAIELGLHDAPAVADDWLDTRLLQPRGAIQQARGRVWSGDAPGADPDEWTLARDDDELWQLTGPDATERAAQTPVADWLRRMSALSIAGLAETSAIEAQAPVMTFEVTDTEGAKTYTFYRPDADGDFLVSASHQPGVFRIRDYEAEPLQVGHAAFVTADNGTPAATPDAVPSPDAVSSP